MVFSSTVFIFLFLPVTLTAYFLAFRFAGKGNIRPANAVLLLASVLFYSWGGIRYLLILLGLIAVNYILTLLMTMPRFERVRKGIFILILALDLLNLLYFKYSGFFAQTVSDTVRLFDREFVMEIPRIVLPIGISFYTFQIISYVADVYRGDVEVQKNPFRLALYVIMFPQLIAGPIVRYTEVEQEIRTRSIRLDDVEAGGKRFIIGFAKKVFLANLTGGVADVMFGYGGKLNTAYCWLGILCYALQIYYDFSAYSDMAIGIGRMLGFRFGENFDHPYISCDIREFWRRWHISLSQWFRDYVYIPLGGSREGTWKTYRNLGIVFLLTGFWHGAAWQFVVWGLYHGAFCILERAGLANVLSRLPKAVRRIYTLLVVLIGWVFFRADSLSEAFTYIANLFSFDFADFKYKLMVAQMTPLFWTCFFLACVFAFFDIGKITARIREKYASRRGNIVTEDAGKESSSAIVCPNLCRAAYLLLWIASVLYLTGLSYNPFIYFKF